VNPRDPAVTAVLSAVLAELAKSPDVRYGEVRFVVETSERLRVKDGRPEQITSGVSSGIAVRVLGTMTWGFSCTPKLDEGAAIRAAREAIAIARASGSLRKTKVAFPEAAAHVGSYATPGAVDPFLVPLDEKLAAVDAPVRALLAAGAHVRSAEAWMEWSRTSKRLMTTEGVDVTNDCTYGAHGMSAIAEATDGTSQRRSYPTWQGGDGFQGGYERIEAIDLLGNVTRVAEELLALVDAPVCPAGTRTVILESSQVGLQIHESCGHPTELDRAMGSEISLAGGSFLQPTMLDRFVYGSKAVTLVADATSPGGMGTFGWDDEGVPGAKRDLVREGLFVDYLSSRETAAAIGRPSTGTMRADGWNRTPLIRMVNVSLEPGVGTLEDLVADTDDGILIATDRSWSIDDLRLNFQFSCEIAWEIKGGKRTRVLKNPLYTGITPSFWGGCDAVAGASDWKLWGIATCGKGDPMQTMKVGHGAAPARFRSVTVGNAGADS